MKALSLWQPWASLIAVGAKICETRDWPPPVKLIGQRIAIHAAKKPIQKDFPKDWDDRVTEALGLLNWDLCLPFGALVCTATLLDAFECGPEDADPNRRWPCVHVLRHLAPRPLPPCFGLRIDNFGNFQEGRWAWALKDVKFLYPPVPFKGRQKLFEVPDSLVAGVQ